MPGLDGEGATRVSVRLKHGPAAGGGPHDEPITPWRIRRLETVGASDEVEDALRRMQRTGVHWALVESEGETAGVLFLEDILEQLVGEVRDSLQR